MSKKISPVKRSTLSDGFITCLAGWQTAGAKQVLDYLNKCLPYMEAFVFYCVACCFCLITMWFPFVTESYKFFIDSYPATNAKKLSEMHASCIFIMIKECHAFPCVHARKNLHHFLEQIDEFHMRYKTIKTNFSPRRCELRTRLHFNCSLPRQSFLHELTNYSLTEIMLVQSRRIEKT